MTLVPIRTVFLSVMLVGVSYSFAAAGALYLNEFATPSMGVAGAGAEALAEDASTNFAFHNPAGMTRLHGKSISLGAGLLSGETEFDTAPNTPFSGGDGGDQGGLAPFLGSHGVWSVSDELKLGMSVFSASAAVLDPHDTWAGRYSIQEIELLTLTANPSVAYRVNDRLSLGGGLMVVYADITYELAAPPGGAGKVTIDGDDFAFGYNFGALLELSPRTRVGAIYVSKVEPEFSGDLEINIASGPAFTTSTDLEFTFPQVVRVGVYHDLNDQWALLGTVGWEDWSEFDELLVSTQMGSAGIPTDWRDTYHFSAGVHYRASEDWLLQAGITHDTSPVSAGSRTAYLPMDRQFRYSIGAQHRRSERLSIGGAFEFIDLGKAKISDPTMLTGEYKTNQIFLFALNLSYQF